ncbi:unnamed protein product [Timema podura]|uniref:Uncharacterized protein n=1 Tax=Timema podura TaxID=61482 RepID=A0ABN7NVA6_TIMPD|nr:unnamed protein product [Timema podura]
MHAYESEGSLEDLYFTLTWRHKERIFILVVFSPNSFYIKVGVQGTREKSCNMEEQLTNQIQILRDQCNEKKSSLQDHVNSIEILREEINMMSEKKAELERRMQTLLQEREALNSGLDDATYKIISLEHQIREQELQLRQCQREVMELHELNSILGSQVETLSNKVQSNNHSLLQEMECDDMSHTNESYKLKSWGKKEICKKQKWFNETCEEAVKKRASSWEEWPKDLKNEGRKETYQLMRRETSKILRMEIRKHMTVLINKIEEESQNINSRNMFQSIKRLRNRKCGTMI